MKKVTSVLAAALVLAIMLCACGGAKGNGKKLSEVYSAIKSQVTLSEMNEFSDVKALDRFYGISADSVEDFAGGVNNSGVNMEEIVLVKAQDDNAAASVETALNNRKQAKYNENKNYNPEQAEMIDKCSVTRSGSYVAMILSPNAEKITSIYKSELGL